jgi:hypothetical protein
VLVVSTLYVLLLVQGVTAPPVSAQSADQVGRWAAVQNWPIVAVHANLLPTGRVLFWAYNDGMRVWDPVTGAITTMAPITYNAFCAAHSYLADGRLFVSGGHIRNNVGLNDASSYNALTNRWTRHADMMAGRWYPSTTTLANGDVLVASGDANVGDNAETPQVWQASTGTWRTLTNAALAMTLYPRTFLAPNGKVFFATRTSRYLDTSGTGDWMTIATRLVAGRDNYGSACMYEPGKILFAGGGDPPTATCEAIDLNAFTPRWQAVGSMATARRQHNLTILPDGTVLATGGSSAAGFNTASGAVQLAERWDPATGTWTSLARASGASYRGYHSTALLLPDGRVLTAGGDNEPDAEVYSPPYLFKGARPTLTNAPSSIGYGQPFVVTTPEAASITNVTLIALGSVTHTQDWNQRFLRLSFTASPGALTVTAPPNGNVCPPGPYMLFLLNGNGVPSVARVLLAGASAPSETTKPAPPTAPTNLIARALSTSRISLNWTHDPADERETGFKIERRRQGETKWAQIGTTDANVTSYTATRLVRNRTYEFRGRAYNAGGNSAYTNLASAQTLGR